MKLCSFRLRDEEEDAERMGVLEGTKVSEPITRTPLLEMLRSTAVSQAAIRLGSETHRLEEVVLGPPVARPGKIVAAIVNTRGMLGGEDVVLDRPRLDMKAPSTVIGPGSKVSAPKSGIRPEVELAAIVGSAISHASVSEAKKAIMGFTILNDVTAPRDSKEDAYQAYRRDKNTGRIEKTTLRGPLFRSKNHDTFCPMGPWVVTAEEMADTAGRRMTTLFDGMMVQDGSTSEYIFKPEEVASYVSGFLELEPGDVVSCGSVGWTKAALGDLDPTEFVLPSKPGKLELQIDGIGLLSNPVVLEQS
ncbi:MAG: fumarylacetoacetate hydrolase family protein [Thaumarchaeota archaeon]|nr:fumarylacetoacetate hydrolase family protein [Nitrososphaerota archaeon]